MTTPIAPARAVLTTARLRLRPVAPRDAPALAALIGDFAVSRWLARVPHPYGLSDARAFLDDIAPREAVWALTRPGDQGDDALIGAIGLSPKAARPGMAELGYWLGRPHWGQGLMSEAAAAVTAHAFEGLGARRLASGRFDGNRASARILDKLGFRETGRSRRLCLATGETRLHIDLALDRPG